MKKVGFVNHRRHLNKKSLFRLLPYFILLIFSGIITEVKFSPVPLEKYDKSGPETNFQLLNKIKEILDENPFASSSVIADTLHENQSIVYRYLTNELVLVYKCTSWIPCNLDFH